MLVQTLSKDNKYNYTCFAVNLQETIIFDSDNMIIALIQAHKKILVYKGIIVLRSEMDQFNKFFKERFNPNNDMFTVYPVKNITLRVTISEIKLGSLADAAIL